MRYDSSAPLQANVSVKQGVLPHETVQCGHIVEHISVQFQSPHVGRAVESAVYHSHLANIVNPLLDHQPTALDNVCDLDTGTSWSVDMNFWDYLNKLEFLLFGDC